MLSGEVHRHGSRRAGTLAERIAGPLVAVTALFCGPVHAADVLEGAGTPVEAADEFGIGVGAAVTSDYISRGITQTDHNPALQGYLEATYGPLYAGVWASNVEFAGDRAIEGDLSLGIRPTIGDASLDFGYIHYVYSEDIVPNYGEVLAKGSYSFSDLTVGVEGYFAPDYVQAGDTAHYVEATASFDLPHDFSVSGAVGYQGFGDALGLVDYLNWNAGLSWTWKEALTLDLRYHDSDLSDADCSINSGVGDACGSRLVATISLDSSLDQLAGTFSRKSD